MNQFIRLEAKLDILFDYLIYATTPPSQDDAKRLANLRQQYRDLL